MPAVQVIDDQVGNTLAAASTLTAEIRAKLNGGGGANKVVAWPLSAERSHLRRGGVGTPAARLPKVHCSLRLQDAAELVGQRIAELCLAKDISNVSFDRGGNIYHGRVKVRTAAHS